MDIWLSKLLGPIIVVLAIPMILSPKSLNNISKSFLEDKPLILVTGVLAMAAGLSIVNSHNVWKLDWALIITLFGWALTIGGASRIVMPHFVIKVGNSIIDSPRATTIAGIIWAGLGGFLIFKGYI